MSPRVQGVPIPRLRTIVAFAACLVIAACAARMPPALPAALKYPDFVYPNVPAALQRSPLAASIDVGWRYLQNDDLRTADREFGLALRRNKQFYPAQAGEGWVAL